MENNEKMNNNFNDVSIETTIKKLREIARQQMRKTGYVNKYNTLQPTALAHEIYIKLQEKSQSLIEPESEDFYKYCTKMVKYFLIDYMRKKNSQREIEFISIDETLDIYWAWDKNKIQAQDYLNLHEALEKFEKEFEQQSKIIEAKYFLGMKDREIAEWLDVSLSKVEKDVKFAKAWLRRELSK